jgi:hypothetical protein
MPVLADRASVGGPSPLHACDQRGGERLPLGRVPALAHTHPLSFVVRWFFHTGRESHKPKRPVENASSVNPLPGVVQRCTQPAQSLAACATSEMLKIWLRASERDHQRSRLQAQYSKTQRARAYARRDGRSRWRSSASQIPGFNSESCVTRSRLTTLLDQAQDFPESSQSRDRSFRRCLRPCYILARCFP